MHLRALTSIQSFSLVAGLPRSFDLAHNATSVQQVLQTWEHSPCGIVGPALCYGLVRVGFHPMETTPSLQCNRSFRPWTTLRVGSLVQHFVMALSGSGFSHRRDGDHPATSVQQVLQTMEHSPCGIIGPALCCGLVKMGLGLSHQ